MRSQHLPIKILNHAIGEDEIVLGIIAVPGPLRDEDICGGMLAAKRLDHRFSEVHTAVAFHLVEAQGHV